MEEEKKEQNLIKCPCCGKLTLEPPVKVKDADLDKYVACMLTGEPYNRIYDLYKGALSVKVSELSDILKDKMNLLTSKFSLLEDGEIKDVANIFITRLFTLIPIERITISDKGAEKSVDVRAVTIPLLEEALQHVQDKEWLNKAYEKLTAKETVLGVSKNILDKVVAKHLENCVLLQESGFDTNFFEGIVQG